METFPFESQIIIVLGICLSLTFFFRILLKRFSLPKMISPLFIGLSFNLLIIFGYLDALPRFKDIILIFANFGIIIVLFYIGLKVDFSFMDSISKNSSIMALNAAFIPFFLGMFSTYLVSKNLLTSLFVGIAIAITAEEIALVILEELNLLKKRAGKLIMEAGIIGDIFEILAIGFLGLIIKSRQLSASNALVTILIELIVFGIVIIIMRYFFISFLLKLIGKHAKNYQFFTASLIVLFVMTVTSELLNFSYVIGALTAGILLKDKLAEDKLFSAEHHMLETIKIFNYGVFHPLIFIWIGLSVDFSILFVNLWFGIFLTVVALGGKIIGSVMGNLFCKHSLREGVLIGWGLNARGATELFALVVARNQGIISTNIFSAVVFMALMTTIISPIAFKYLVKKGYGLKNDYL